MRKKAIVVFGGWEEHTPRESTELFARRLEEEGFRLTRVESLEVYDEPARLREADLVVQCWTFGRLTPERERALVDAVAAGTGFAGWHGGVLDAFRENRDYQFMTGGQWVAHPGGCVPAYRVDVADPDHPVTRGVEGFTLRDTEQYYCHVDPGVHVLCTTTFTGEHGPPGRVPPGTVMPYAWTRTFGEGRVFAASWGHTYRDFDVPEARRIVERGLLWAARALDEGPG